MAENTNNQHLYFYQGQNISLQNWVKVFTEYQIKVLDTTFNLKIIGYSHQIEIISTTSLLYFNLSRFQVAIVITFTSLN